MSNRLREIVEEIQHRRKWTQEQVAKSIGYTRVSLLREMGKPEASAYEDMLLQKHADILQNVSLPPPEVPLPLGGFRPTVKDYVEEIKGDRDYLRQLLRTSLVDISSHLGELLKKHEGAPASSGERNGQAAVPPVVVKGYSEDGVPFQNKPEVKYPARKRGMKHGKDR
jgi:hypothetical protein